MEHQKFRDGGGGRLGMKLEEGFLVSGGLNDGQPVLGQALLVEISEVEEELEVGVHQARRVFGALNVAGHPVETVRNAAEHRRKIGWSKGGNVSGGSG